MTKDIIEIYLEQGLEKLKEVQHLPYLHGGIPFHEALAFLCVIEATKPTLIIDSGIGRGRSVDIWATAYPNTEIISMDDLSVTRNRPHVKLAAKRIKKYPNVEVRLGEDSVIEIPGILKNLNKDDRVVICLDGPKYEKAISFATELVKTPQVKAFSIHDMDSICGKSKGMNNHFQNVFYTNSPTWLERFGGKFEDPAKVSHYSWYPNGTGMAVYIKS